MSNLFAISPLVLLIGFLSFQSNPSATDLDSYSKEEIFQGIFFGQGAFADNIPELARYRSHKFSTNGEEAKKAMEFQNKVMQKVNSAHPGYLASLQRAVLTGKHVQIQASIYEGIKYLDAVVWSVDESIDQTVREKLMADLSKKVDANTTPDQLNKIVDNYLDGISAENPELAQQLCVLVLAVVVAVAVGVFLWVVYIVETSLERTALANEQIINAIAAMR